MAQDELEQDVQESKKLHYPLDPNSYHLLDEIGRGLHAIVYKATCIPLNSSLVAIKSIDLDRSRADLENVRREAKTMSLLSHPNILKAHCSFTVDCRLWVVMPFMSAGSIQSIIASSFPTGLSEPCTAVILKETLMGLGYLHDQGHLHRDIKAGNILMDLNGSIKLADFGVSASVYESMNPCSFMLNEVTGTPYWMAPEVIHSRTGYSYKADIWSLGITALELAHGRPPLSHLPFSKSIFMKITRSFRFSDYGKGKDNSKHKKFSKSFKDMVGLCLEQDPSRRPCAEKFLKHPFFKNCKGSDFLVKNLLQGMPSVEQRVREMKLQRLGSMSKSEDGDDEGEGGLLGSNVKQRRISGWNFNFDGFELDPIYPSDRSGEIDEVVKQVRFGGESIILEKAGESDASTASSPGQVMGKPEVICGGSVGGGGVDKEAVAASLMVLKRSLDEQREKVMSMISLVGGEEGGLEVMSREEQLIQVMEKLRMELEIEKRKNSELMLELELLRLQVNCGSDI